MCSAIAGLFSLVVNIGMVVTPAFSTEILGALDTQVGVLVATPGILAVLLMIPSTPLSNRFGRRKIMIVSAVANVLAALLYLFADSTLQVFFAQVVFGAANAFFWPSNLTYLAEAAGPGFLEKAQATNTSFQGIGLILGPVLAGSLIRQIGYQGALGLWFITALVNLILSVKLKAVPSQAASVSLSASIRQVFVGIPAMFKNPRLVVAMASQFLSAAFMVSIGGAFLVLFVQDIGYNATLAGLLLSFREVFGTLSRALYPFVRRYVSNLTILSAAPVICGLALLCSFIWPSLPVLLMGVAAAGFSLGILAPAGNIEASRSVSQAKLAETIAVVVSMFQMGAVIFPWTVGLVVGELGRARGLTVASMTVTLMSLWPIFIAIRQGRIERQVSL